MKKLCDTLATINQHMREAGFQEQVIVKNDHIRITGKEVIIKMPFILTLKIPRDEFSGDDDDVSHAVSRAISRAISLNKGS